MEPVDEPRAGARVPRDAAPRLGATQAQEHAESPAGEWVAALVVVAGWAAVVLALTLR